MATSYIGLAHHSLVASGEGILDMLLRSSVTFVAIRMTLPQLVALLSWGHSWRCHLSQRLRNQKGPHGKPGHLHGL